MTLINCFKSLICCDCQISPVSKCNNSLSRFGLQLHFCQSHTYDVVKFIYSERATNFCLYVHAIWSYNQRWDFPRAGSSLFLPRFSVLTFLRFLGPFFIFSEIFTSGVLYFLFCALIFHIFSSIIHFTGYLIF